VVVGVINIVKTNIYHISYTPESKFSCLHFWGCNIECKGCLCKREIWSSLLKGHRLDHLTEPPKEIAQPPERFLDFEEVMQILGKLDVEKVRLEGMEPTIDPQYAKLTKALHDRLGTYNIVATNLYEMPSFEDTDMVVCGITAFTDSLHREYTGKSNEKILENMIKVYQSGIKLHVSPLFIPDYIGADETERIAKFTASIDKDIPCFIFPYYKAGDNPWRRPTHEEIDEAVGLAKRYLTNVYYYYGDEDLDFDVVTIFPDADALEEIRGRRSV